MPYEALRAPAPAEGRYDRHVPRDSAVGLLRRRDDPFGLLFYAKISLTADAPSRLQAYQEKTPIFPCHPTSDQFFDAEQFECYRLLGRHTTENLLTLRADTIAVLRERANRDDAIQRGLTSEELTLLNELRPDQATNLLAALQADRVRP
jgi:hypothetical protein